jgi:hypothetical protein
VGSYAGGGVTCNTSIVFNNLWLNFLLSRVRKYVIFFLV